MQYAPNPFFGSDENLSDGVSFSDEKIKRGSKGKKYLPGNKRLDSSLHDSVLRDLDELLSKDPSFEAEYLREVILSKFVGPNTDSAHLRASRAVDKWLATELRNRKTNWRLIELHPDHCEVDFGWMKLPAFVNTVRSLIAKVIGDEPPEECLYGTFSGGASTSLKREEGVLFRKFATQADVTSEAYETCMQVVSSCDTWRLTLSARGLLEPRVVDGNVMFTVPKSTTIDRVAAKEPDLNCLVQKGAGDYIRRRLKLKAGIDLNDQSVNRRLAQQGSKDGSLATLDLSSASDSIATQLVYLLLPPKWAIHLDTIRSQRTRLPDGSMHYNEMFSSMGNGFTFELESLLFWSIVKAVCYHSGIRGRVSVFGDDIICPTGAARRVARLFNFFGFTVNPEKSFWSGRFRESCGGHYYRGLDVTPFYVKEPIDTTERLVHFLNRLRKWAGTGLCRDGYFDLWKRYASKVDSRLHGGWNVGSPYALVGPKLKKVSYRLKPKYLPLSEELLNASRQTWLGSKVEFTEQDVLQLGGYLFALRTIDGREPRFLRVGNPGDAGEMFIEDPLAETSSEVKRIRGWTSERNIRPSWHDGQYPVFPEEMGYRGHLTDK